MVDFKHPILTAAFSLIALILFIIGIYTFLVSSTDLTTLSFFIGSVLAGTISDIIGIRHIKKLFVAAMFADAFNMLGLILIVFSNTLILSILCFIMAFVINAKALHEFNKRNTIEF